MRTLPGVTPTPEQLKIISVLRPGDEIIKGAAGSGKTTTALLKLKSLLGMHQSRRAREQDDTPVKALVLTFNRTLRGYINALAQAQIAQNAGIDLEVYTFAKWAMEKLGKVPLIAEVKKESKLLSLYHDIPNPKPQFEFLLGEFEYATSRFLPENMDSYLTARRDGRGANPRVERSLREQIISKMIRPYEAWLQAEQKVDWNDLAVHWAKNELLDKYDIIIVDETQDFSANQLRALRNQVKDVYSLTFIVDTAQRIYARGFLWREAGINLRPEQVHRLETNYRNTIEIAKFAAPLLKGIPLDDDATLPDFSKCIRHGHKPKLIEGKYNQQLSYIANYIDQHVDLSKESIAFLKPLGGKWFNSLKSALEHKELQYADLTRKSEWPDDDTNIALCTLHSAKGLEFDHVIMIGLNAENVAHETDQEDDRHIMLRRLLAMGIGRAKKSVIIGYKQENIPYLLSYLDKATYDLTKL